MASSETNFELAHILFMDLKMLINDQREVMRDLNAIVRGTEQFRAAEAQKKLICLPIGDGMVLVFFTAPDAAARCAIEIPRTLHQHPATRLRMGIHCGPVTAVTDASEPCERRWGRNQYSATGDGSAARQSALSKIGRSSRAA